MATTPLAIRNRLTSLCTSAPFSLTPAITPFDFTKQPSGQIEGVFRITLEGDPKPIGGFNFTEERTDRVDIWIARKQGADAQATYATCLTDAADLRAAIVRDGAQASGEYAVPDAGAGLRIEHEPNAMYAVLRLSLAVNYEVDLS